jgi:trk system potassium uptake protein TrkA
VVHRGTVPLCYPELNTTNRFGIWILLLYRNEEPIQPTATTTLIQGDIMIVFGKKKKLHLFEAENFGKKSK